MTDEKPADLLGAALAREAFLLFDGGLGTMLQARGMAPGAVAACLGFSDQAHLTRVFKARTALTPGAYASMRSQGKNEL